MVDKTHAHDNQPPGNDQESHGPFDPKSDESHVTGKLKDGVTGEEKQETNRVSGSNCQSQLLPHPGNLSLTDVDTVNDGHT